jgi:hypothetical protein
VSASQSSRRALTIGRALVHGPRALFPPETLDDFGWLEPELRLIYWKPPMKTYVSLAIYCDNTANRETNFLRPIIRFAQWDRYHDLATHPAWPTTDIQLSYFDDQFDCVHQQVYAFHTALTHLPFSPFGISAQRDMPVLPTDDSTGELEIVVSNGVQRLEFSTPALPAVNHITQHFFTLFEMLSSILQPFDRNGWRERYDYNLDTLYPLKAWDWDGTVPNAVS